MTASVTETASARPSPGAESWQPLPEDIDHSCRLPVMFLFTWGIVWLIVSLIFGVLGSIKMHAPGMLANEPALTYGRVVAVGSTAFLWGFASQAGIGIALWL